MAFMNFSGFFYARNDLRLFKIEKKNELKSFFYKDYTLSSYKDDLNLNNEIFFYQSLKEGLFRFKTSFCGAKFDITFPSKNYFKNLSTITLGNFSFK